MNATSSQLLQQAGNPQEAPQGAVYGFCPSCGRALHVAATACPHCRPIFDHTAVWRVLPDASRVPDKRVWGYVSSLILVLPSAALEVAFIALLWLTTRNTRTQLQPVPPCSRALASRPWHRSRPQLRPWAETAHAQQPQRVS